MCPYVIIYDIYIYIYNIYIINILLYIYVIVIINNFLFQAVAGSADALNFQLSGNHFRLRADLEVKLQ